MRPIERFWCVLAMLVAPAMGRAGEHPVAIFHAFNEPFSQVARYVCTLAEQGFSHVQISPVQKSNPASVWYARYQPLDYSVIEGLGSEADLRALVKKAHGCGRKVIADVVFNHVASMPEHHDLEFPQHIGPSSFHERCRIEYADGDRFSEVSCWLGACDAFLATTFVLAREEGTPLILAIDTRDGDSDEHRRNAAMVRADVKFRQIMRQRVAIEKRDGARKKYVTRWGTWSRGGIQVHGREALFFIRDVWKACER